MTDYTIDTSDLITTAAGVFRVRVEADPENDTNPRSYGKQLGTWVSWNKPRWFVSLPQEGDLTGRIKDAYDRGGTSLVMRYLSSFHDAVVLPVYGGQYSNDRPSPGQLGERVDDSPRITGVIYAKRDSIALEWSGLGFMPSDDEIAGWLRTEVEQYATWAAGDMTSYTVERATCGEDSWDHSDHGCECWATVTACGGYFRSEDAMAAGRDAVPTGIMPKDLEALDALNSARRACDLADTQSLARAYGPFGLVMRAFLMAATAVLGTRYMAVQVLDLLIGSGESVTYCLDYLAGQPDYEPEWITPNTYA